MVGNWLGCCGFMLASVCSATFARKCGFIYPIMRSFRVFVYESFLENFNVIFVKNIKNIKLLGIF